MTGIMKFYRHLYVSESIRNPEKVKWKLRANAGQFSIYIIALAKSDDQLDIFHCALLQQKFYDKEDLFIVGLAASYTEAVDMVVAMTEKVVRETGGSYTPARSEELAGVHEFLFVQWALSCSSFWPFSF